MQSAVRCDGTISEYFPVNTGVPQACVLAPTLSNSCINCTLIDNLNQCTTNKQTFDSANNNQQCHHLMTKSDKLYNNFITGTYIRIIVP